MIGDILVKIANEETLSEIEKQQLRLWGDRMQENGEFVNGIQNGTGRINAESIYANTIKSDVREDSGYRLWMTNDSYFLSVANNTPTTLVPTGWTTRYNYGFLITGEYIKFPLTGYYQVRISGSWDAGSTGYREMSFQSGSQYVYEKKSAAGEGGREHSISNEILVSKGESLTFIVRHTDGGNLTFRYPSIQIRLASV